MPDRKRLLADEQLPDVSRRRALKAAGGATALFLAGCQGTDEEVTPPDSTETTGDETDTGGQGGQADATYKTYLSGPLKDVQIQNNFGRNLNADLAWMTQPHIGRLATSASFHSSDETHTHNKIIPMGSKSIDVGENAITIELHDDWQWTTGKEVTSKDLALRLRLENEKTLDSEVWNNITEITEEGEKTVKIHLSEEINQDYIATSLFTRKLRMDTPYKIDGEKTKFVEFLQRFQDASSEEKITSIDEELYDYTDVSLADTVLCGPWNVRKTTESVAAFEPNDGFYGDVNFSSKAQHLGGSGARGQALAATLSGRLDAGPLPKPEHLAGLDESLDVVIRRGAKYQGLAVNMDTSLDNVPDVFANAKFRQGLAYAIDAQKVSDSSPTRSSPVENVDGIELNSAEKIPQVHDKLRTYEQDTDKAASLFQEAGLTKSDGKWMLPSGEPLKIEMYSPPWHHWPTLSQTTASQLQDFGIQIDHTVSGDVFIDQMWVNNDYTIGRNSIKVAHPVMSLRRVFKPDNEFGLPETLEVPTPIGNYDGSLEEWNVAELSSKLVKSTGEEYTNTLEKLAWAFNYWIPMVPTNTENWGMLYRVDKWDWPSSDDPRWAVDYQNRSLMSEGLMQPK